MSPRLVETPLRPTTICKTRFVASGQQVVRTHDESRDALCAAEEERLIEAATPPVQAIVLSDYGKGVIGRTVITRTIQAVRASGVPVFVDPKSPDFALYQGVTCLTPNLKELAAASRMPAEIVVDDEWYLKQYPNVAESIKDGLFESAAEHFRLFGYTEGRKPFAL